MATTIAKSPLPALNSSRIEKLRLHDRPHRFSAYTMILRAEQYAVQERAEDDVVSARAAGYFLLEFDAQPGVFGDEPCASIVRQVTSPAHGTGNNIIFDVGKLCRDKLIRLFWTSAVVYLPPASHSSRPSFDTLEDMVEDSMESTGGDYETAKKKALARDGYRCMISGMFDQESLDKSAVLEDMAERDGANGVSVQACHILTKSMTPEVTSDDTMVVNQTHHTAEAVAILEHFGLTSLAVALNKPGGVHQVWNLLSLEPNLRSIFDRLDLWFERTCQPNRYKVCVFREGDETYIRRNFVRPKPHVDGAPMVVEFNSTYEKAPPPNPQLLALHATCARVAHMSGAAEVFGKVERDAEETKDLAFGGSSARLLSDLTSLLSPFLGLGGRADRSRYEFSPLNAPDARSHFGGGDILPWEANNEAPELATHSLYPRYQES